MKVNFDGSFKDVQRVISVRPDRSASKEEFSNLLSSISPDKPQAVETTSNKSANLNTKPEQHEAVRARPNLASAQLIAPSIDVLHAPVLPSDEDLAPVNKTLSSVKTPTIVSARRIPAKDPFAGLTESQRIEKVRDLAQGAGLKHGVDPALSMAVVKTESGFNARAVSKDGFDSKGLMQLLDSTGRQELAKQDETRVYSPFDPHLNVDLGVSYLRYLHDIFSHSKALPNNLVTQPAANSSSLEKLAVAAYNAGEGRVASAQSRAQKDGKNPGVYEEVESYLPEMTREYVKKVSQAKHEFEAQLIG